jgi:hypothetical protein
VWQLRLIVQPSVLPDVHAIASTTAIALLLKIANKTMHILKINFFAIVLPLLFVVAVGTSVPKAQSLPQEVAAPTEGVDLPTLPKCKKGQKTGCTTM